MERRIAVNRLSCRLRNRRER